MSKEYTMILRQHLQAKFPFLMGLAVLAIAGCTKSDLTGNAYLTYGAGESVN